MANLCSLQIAVFPPTTLLEAFLTVCLLAAIAAASWVVLSVLQQKQKQKQKVKVTEDDEQKKLRLPPGRMGLPILGETLEFLRKQKQNRAWEFTAERVEEYGGETFKTSLFGYRTVVVTSPAGNKMAFANVNISWPSSVVEVIGSKSLLAFTGERAQSIRNSFHAFLNPESLRRYTRRVSQVVVSVLLDQRIDSHPPHHRHEAKEILAYPFMKRLMFSIICSVLVGIHDPSSQDSLFSHFCTLLQGILQIPINLPGTRYRNASSAARSIKRILQKLIDHKRSTSKLAMAAAAADPSPPVDDMLSGLMAFKDDRGNPMSDDEIKDNLVLLLFAGNDTSSIAATMTCRFLALHPSIMDDVYRENKEVAQGILASGGSHPKWEDLYKLKLTWRVIQETLRLQPPAQGSFKVATEDFSFDGYRIPKSWKIYWSTNSTARNPKYFPEPEKFDPSRFEGAGPAPFTYAPFGGGPRMCPGYEFARMELLIIFHHLVTRFSWTLKYPDERITLDSFPRPVKGLPILLQPRTESSPL